MTTNATRKFRANFVATAFTMCFCLGACDGSTEPSSEAPATGAQAAGERDGETRVYWTTTDESGAVVIRSEPISAQQKEELLAARKMNREKTSSERSPFVKHTLETVGSTDWETACKYYDWILFSDQSDFQGNIFCATHQGSSYTIIRMPFVPRWYDASTTYSNMLCSSSIYGVDNCYLWDCAVGPDFRAMLYANSGGGNLSLPSDTLYIMSDAWRSPC